MSAPTEVVTRALVRDVLVPVPGHDDVRVALVTLTNGQDHRRPTTFGPGGLIAVERTLAALRDRDDLDAVAVTGKPFVFAVGADHTMLGSMTSRADVLAAGRLGHRVFGHLSDLTIPTFAFLNGAAIGGGLELALHCTYRSVSTAVTTLSLPEVSLGIVPAWGGSWLLPHLVGPEHAVRLVVEDALTGANGVDGATAVDLGLADVLLEPADFLTASLRWAADLVRERAVPQRPDVRRDAGAWAAAVDRGRAVADARTHGSLPAAYRALDLIAAARTASREEGFAAEDEALADLLPSPEARASLYAFDLVHRGAKRPSAARAGTARPITKVGVAGAGLMARQLAVQVAGRLGVPVVLIDQDADRVEQGLRAVNEQIDSLHQRGTFGADKANRVRALVSGDTRWSSLADCDLVVEAVYEDLEVKHAVLRALEAVVREDCVLASNTSALSVTQLAEGCAHPERVVGTHFFNPVAAMPLVEVVVAPSTDEATTATALAFVAALGKTAVRCADSPGFLVNRLLNAFVDAAVSAVDDGTPPQDVEDAILGLGVPMGPFRLLELVGPAVALHVSETMAAAFPERFAVPTTLRRLVERGVTTTTVRRDGTRRLDPDLARNLTTDGDPLTADEVRDRALRAVAEEVLDLLRTGVVTDHRDIDLCLLLGAGWPAHLGGITPELRRRGLLPA